MKRLSTYFIFSLALLAVALALPFALFVEGTPEREREEKKPNDWFFQQRSYPYRTINYDAYRAAQRQAATLRMAAKRSINGIAEWIPDGPSNIGGRVTSLDIHPSDTLTIYAGTGAGGVFKTTDGGNTWKPIFDEQGSLAIGDVTIDPKAPNVIYVGTGEANFSAVCYPGNGVYKSTDGGETWRHIGLDSTRYIGRVIVDPFDSRRIYVLAMGELFAGSTARGLYRSNDAGETWEKILYKGELTGCIDMAIHPTDPSVLFVTTWERSANPATRRLGGPGSAIYKSADGGTTWTRVAGGFPAGSLSRIGIAIAPSNPNRMYAIVTDSIGEFGGIYRSDNGGNTWARTQDGAIDEFFYLNFGWWFGVIRVDPRDPDLVYALGIDTRRSTDGGASWEIHAPTYQVHADHHDLYIHHANPDFMVDGNDGGIYITRDKGTTWTHAKNFPATQFYTCEVDYQYPYRRYGGTQDNNTIRTITGRTDDWYSILGGDGFVVRVDPTDNRYVYAEMQYGSFYRSTNGGEQMQFGIEDIAFDEYEDRFNWNTPFTLDPSDPKTLYIGSQRIYRSTNRAESWVPVSPDLTKPPVPGSAGGSLTTIAVAPGNPAVIYAGSSDGNVWVTQNRGVSWTQINGALPQRWVTRVAVDPLDAKTAYVTLSGFRYLDYQPHILKTVDAGNTWIDVSGDLPEAPVNDVVIDPRNRKVLFAATDVGVFYTEDGGEEWMPLGTGMPNIPVMDLELHPPTRRLVAATFGRSMFSIDVSSVARAGDDRAGSRTAAAGIASSPVPFSASSTLRFTLPSAGEGELDVYDLSGRRVRRLVQGRMEAGETSAVWDGRRDDGTRAAPGGYFYRLRAGDVVLSGRTVLQ